MTQFSNLNLLYSLRAPVFMDIEKVAGDHIIESLQGTGANALAGRGSDPREC